MNLQVNGRKILLAIESSCDETACALFDLTAFENQVPLEDCIIAEKLSSQVKLHSDFGGVVPELASREHIRNLPILVRKLFEETKIDEESISKIAVTAGPGLKGCLLVGVGYAKGFSFASDISLMPINHLEAHILSGFYQLTKSNYLNKLPALALLVSGGHTQILLIEAIGKYKIIANTQDDAAGEAFDKIGSILGFKYPAGRELSERARSGAAIYSLPQPVQNINDSFSFSGLKTAAGQLIKKEVGQIKSDAEKEKFINDFSASVELCIVQSLVNKFEFWITELAKSTKLNSIILCGGVAANELLKTTFRELGSKNEICALMPPQKFCTDNASMVAIAAALKLDSHPTHSFSMPFHVRARWPLSEL